MQNSKYDLSSTQYRMKVLPSIIDSLLLLESELVTFTIIAATLLLTGIGLIVD